MLERNVIETIRERTDIVGLVSADVPELKRAGHSWKALCPFHRERNPSFNVYPDSGTFVCYTCGQQGDAIDWLTKFRGLDWTDAVKDLCVQANLPDPFVGQAPIDPEIGQLHEINKHVAQLAKAALYENSNLAARTYLQHRQIKAQAWEQWGLGYYPHEGFLDELTVYSGTTLANSGLVVRRNNQWREPFAGRLMFPLFSAKGQYLGLAGRVLGEGIPKYLNSPNSIVFEKGNYLYGLHIAGRHIRARGKAIVVEGYFDVIAAHAAGTSETVGVLGVGLSDRHIAALSRYAPELVLALDSDKAGQAATFAWAKKASSLAHIRVAALVEAKDAHELLLLPEGKGRWNQAIEQAQPIVTHLITTLGPQAKTIQEKQRLAGELWSLCEKTTGIERESYLEEIAAALRVSVTALAGTLRIATPVLPSRPTFIPGKPITVLTPGEMLFAFALTSASKLEMAVEALELEDFPPGPAQEALTQLSDLALYGSVSDETSFVGEDVVSWVTMLLGRFRDVTAALPPNRNEDEELSSLTLQLHQKRWQQQCEYLQAKIRDLTQQQRWEEASATSIELQRLAQQKP